MCSLLIALLHSRLSDPMQRNMTHSTDSTFEVCSSAVESHDTFFLMHSCSSQSHHCVFCSFSSLTLMLTVSLPVIRGDFDTSHCTCSGPATHQTSPRVTQSKSVPLTYRYSLSLSSFITLFFLGLRQVKAITIWINHLPAY